MPADFAAVFAALKPLLAGYEHSLKPTADSPAEYTLIGKRPSPFPQHKGTGMYFASVRLSKAYVSFHLMPLNMNPKLNAGISPELKQRRMQGKTCFNFKSIPEKELLDELRRLTEAGFQYFREQGWL